MHVAYLLHVLTLIRCAGVMHKLRKCTLFAERLKFLRRGIQLEQLELFGATAAAVR